MNDLRRKSSSWNEGTIYALGLYKFIGQNLGIWPLRCNNIASKMRLLVIAILQIIMNYNLIREVASGCISSFDAVDFIGLLTTNTVCMLKIWVIRLNEEKMRQIWESAVNDWSVVRDNESLAIMRKLAYRGKFVSIFQISIAHLCAGFVIIGALPTLGTTTERVREVENLTVTQLRNLPMGTGCSVVNAPIFSYLGLYSLQVMQLICVCACNFGIDSLFVGMAMHICAQFELLRNRILEVDQHDGEKKWKQRFATLIQRHNHLINLLNFVEDIFHPIIVGQVLASGLHLLLLGIQILFALRDHHYTVLAYASNGIILLLLQLFMYSFVGDCLSTQAKEMRTAVYNCSWYNFSPSFAKDILFVIMRNNDSFHLTAGKVFRMNIEGFSSIVKTMASFFSVLKIFIIG